MIVTNENLFLIVLAIVWIIGAMLQDLRRREVDNIWNFSLIAFALAYRLSVSAFNGNYWFFINGLIGFGVFLILGNLFYYGRLFAGGDAKLIIALGAVLPLSYDWIVNTEIFGLFVGGFLVGGSIYVFLWALVLAGMNYNFFVKEYKKQAYNHRYYFKISFAAALIFAVLLSFMNFKFSVIGAVFILFPFLFVFARAVEEVCMVKSVSVNELRPGDWLYEDLYVKGKKIKKDWEGLSDEEIKLIQKKYNREVVIKYGVPFTPSFLIGFIFLLFWL